MKLQSKEKISIIGQCFNEEKALLPFYQAMCRLMDQMSYVDFELIFVDDCSRDGSLDVIRTLATQDTRVRYLSMSRNFGKDPCAMAGFRYATGDYITTMDLDLEDPPEILLQMYDAVKKEGYDIAAAKADRHGYTPLHKLCVNIFYTIFNGISSVKIVNGQRDYRLMRRRVVDAILQHGEYNLFNKGLLNDIGFKVKWLDYNYDERSIGRSKFPYIRSVKYAVTGLFCYSVAPLVCILLLGLVMLAVSLCLIIALIVTLAKGQNSDYVTLLALMVSLNAVNVVCMGIVAMYISQIHKEVKHRPRYIVGETDQSVGWEEI